MPLSRLFLQELAKFFLSLSGSSSLGAPGVLAGVTASAAASGGIACPASTAAGAATFCAATVTPAGAGVLPAAPAAVPGVSGDQQRQGVSRSRGRRSRSSGDGTDGRAKSALEEGLLLLTALRLAGGGLGGVSVAYGLFSSVGRFACPPRLEVLGRILPLASGRSFFGAPQRGSYRLVDCCLASLWADVCGLP